MQLRKGIFRTRIKKKKKERERERERERETKRRRKRKVESRSEEARSTRKIRVVANSPAYKAKNRTDGIVRLNAPVPVNVLLQTDTRAPLTSCTS